MGRLARSEEICEAEVGIYHVTSRCVRRAFLMGKDVATRRSYDERREWLLGLLMRYAPHFKVDVYTVPRTAAVYTARIPCHAPLQPEAAFVQI